MARISLDYGMGFIDTTGKIVIKPNFGHVEDFSDGLAIVREYGKNNYRKYGFINTSGEVVIQLKYDCVGRFSNGLAYVGEYNLFINKCENYGYIDPTGKIVIRQQFQEANDFGENGLALVKINNKYGFIDSTGKYAIEPKFDDIDYIFPKEQLEWIKDNENLNFKKYFKTIKKQKKNVEK